MGKIRIGDISATAFKLGGADISLYLGAEKLYPTESPEPDYSSMYLTIESLEDNNTIGWGKKRNFAESSGRVISASTDGGTTWNGYSSDSDATIATLNTGEKILVKGTNTEYSDNWGGGNGFTSTGQFKVYGNIMSLTNGDNFVGVTEMPAWYGIGGTFFYLFKESGVADAQNLVLPATTLTNYCYISMFAGCASLTAAPALPATTLVEGCYADMFWDCTNLTTAPILPATTLAQSCYQNMFHGCTNLNYIKMLATDISASSCLNRWVEGVGSTGTFVKNAAMTSLPTGDSGIPSGWTVEDAA